MAKKKKVKIPEGACPFCLVKHDPKWFVPPETPDDPNIIIVGEAPGNEELRAGQPFIGRSGRLLRKILTKYGARPIILNSKQCWSREKPTTEQITQNREVFLLPILEKYPNIPIVALGAYAATYVLGGKHGETSMAGKVLELYGRVCSFTYHPAYFLYTQDERILEDIESTIATAFVPIETPKYIEGRLPKDVSDIVVDIETSDIGYPWYGSDLILVGIMPRDFVPYVLREEQITPDVVAYLNENTRRVTGHNLMYDLVGLAHRGITFPHATLHDTMIYQKNLYPNEHKYGLKYLAKKHLKFPHWDAWFHRQLTTGADLKTIDKHKFMEYNAYDLYATEQLAKTQTRVYQPFNLEMDYMKYIVQMTVNGMHVDRKQLDVLIQKYGLELAEEELKLKELRHLGVDFNFRSPNQVLNLLQKEDPKIKDTKEATLLEYKANGNIVVDHLLNIRDLSKLVGTGLEGLRPWLDGNDNVHSMVLVHGAETGRSASSHPNVQNTDRRVRPLFVSRYEKGNLIYTDLSSLEYRIIAHMARERKLIHAFTNGLDIHRMAYGIIFNREPADEEERKVGKTCNYLGVYGGGYGKFLATAKLSDSPEARRAYERIISLYPAINKWKSDISQRLRASGSVYSLFGRKRDFPKVGMDEEREGVNWIIQSSGHDILKIYLMEAMDVVLQQLPGTLLINETHDSFTLDAPASEAEAAKDIVQATADDLTDLIAEIFGVKMALPITAKVKRLDKWE